MAPRLKAKIGDIFQIPIDEACVGYGQVVMQPENKVLFICVFSATAGRSDKPDLAAVVGSDILLAGNTFDAKIWHGDWPVVGNMPPNMKAIALPNYKEGLPGQAFVESLDLTKRRRATPAEEQLLSYRSYFAPVCFQDAFRALNGIGKWDPDYDELRYEQVRRSSEVII